MKKVITMLVSLLTVVSTWASTFFPSRTDFRDEQIYFVITTRFYDGDPSNNTQCWDNQSKNAGDPAWRGDFKGLIEKLDYIKAADKALGKIPHIMEMDIGHTFPNFTLINGALCKVRYKDGKGDIAFKLK